MPHVMLSYQWDNQALVKRIYDRLKEDGISVWLDIEGGVSGNINDAMAAGVEEAAVICPFMTPAYQASRSCKKELSYADTREVTIVPVMLSKNWEASEWLGLITAGLLWVDFRNAQRSDEHFEKCVRTLEEEIMFNAGHLLTLEEPPQDYEDRQEEEEEEQEHGPPRKPCMKRKPGRSFRHALTCLYLRESGEQKFPPDSDARDNVELMDVLNAVELHDNPGNNGYWEEIKANGCKHYRNVVTNGYLGLDPRVNYVYTKASPHEAEEWLLVVDQSDHSHERAVVIKNKHSGRFLAVQNGQFLGCMSYTEDCKWYLE